MDAGGNAQFDTAQFETNALYFKKTFAMHVLSANILKYLQLSLIESELYNNPDTTNRLKPDGRMWNPIMMIYGPNSTIHVIWAINAKLKLCKQLNVYGQVIADNLGGNGSLHYGGQAGFKYFDAFGLKGLFFQGELNLVTPNTYTNSNSILNWNHIGEPLAHPYGNNFREAIFFIDYNWHRWILSSESNITRQLKYLSTENVPPNMKPIPGIPYYMDGQKLFWQDVHVSWYINPKTMMNLTMGYTYRQESLPGTVQTMNYVYFAFRTSLTNLYWDL